MMTMASAALNTDVNSNSNNSHRLPLRLAPTAEFHHCYLLQSQTNKNKTYIGYTTNPIRRIKQHNGIIKGGANKTSRNRPWDIICVISGFINNVDGLKFEWAWQNPNRSLIFRSGFSKSNPGDENGNSNDDNNMNSGSNKALVDIILKSSGRVGTLRYQLTVLMTLLCECDHYKSSKLRVNFLKDDNRLLFQELFLGNRNTNYNDDDDNEFSNWCQALPTQMECVTVPSLEVLPFFTNKKTTKKKSKKNNNNKNKQKRKRIIDGKDTEMEKKQNNKTQKENVENYNFQSSSNSKSRSIYRSHAGGDYGDDNDDSFIFAKCSENRYDNEDDNEDDNYEKNDEKNDDDNRRNKHEFGELLGNIQNLSLIHHSYSQNKEKNERHCDVVEKGNTIIELLDDSSHEDLSDLDDVSDLDVDGKSLCAASQKTSRSNSNCISSDDETIDLISNVKEVNRKQCQNTAESSHTAIDIIDLTSPLEEKRHISYESDSDDTVDLLF